MGNPKIHVFRRIHPLGEGIRNSLWQSAAVGSPGENDLRTFHGLMFLNGNQVSKGLQRVNGCRFHGKYRTAGVFDKLIHDSFRIVEFAVRETRKGTDTNQITIASHHGNGFQQMLALITIHDHATLGLQFPGSGIHIEYDDVHTQVHGCLLCAETRTQTIVEENHHQRLVLAQMLIFETLVLNLLCFS